MLRSFISLGTGILALVLGSLCVGGCATEPIADLNECRSFRGSVENPWKIGTFQTLAGSSDAIDTESSSALAESVEKLDLYVMPAKIETSLTQTNFNYDPQLLERQLFDQTLSSARKWGRFRTVDNPAEADLFVQPTLSMLVIEGDAYKSMSELQSTYKPGLFGGSYSAQQLADKSREILKAQVSLDYFDTTKNGIHSSRVTTFYAKGFGTFTGRYITPNGELSESMTIDRAKQTGLVGPHLAPLMGQSADAAFVDSFQGKGGLDQQLWLAEADKADGVRRVRRTVTTSVPTNQ
jgi:hypothetical protein